MTPTFDVDSRNRAKPVYQTNSVPIKPMPMKSANRYAWSRPGGNRLHPIELVPSETLHSHSSRSIGGCSTMKFPVSNPAFTVRRFRGPNCRAIEQLKSGDRERRVTGSPNRGQRCFEFQSDRPDSAVFWSAAPVRPQFSATDSGSAVVRWRFFRLPAGRGGRGAGAAARGGGGGPRGGARPEIWNLFIAIYLSSRFLNGIPLIRGVRPWSLGTHPGPLVAVPRRF